MTYFFQKYSSSSKVEESHKTIGFASKSDIEGLTSIINKMQKEIAGLKASLQIALPVKKKKA